MKNMKNIEVTSPDPEVAEAAEKVIREQLPQRVKDYDAHWGVTGYYLDGEGFDIRDRD